MVWILQQAEPALNEPVGPPASLMRDPSRADRVKQWFDERLMGIRSTIARTRDDEEIFVPDSTLVQSTVKNYTLRDSLYHLRTEVGVAIWWALRDEGVTIAFPQLDLHLHSQVEETFRRLTRRFEGAPDEGRVERAG